LPLVAQKQQQQRITLTAQSSQVNNLNIGERYHKRQSQQSGSKQASGKFWGGES